MSDAVLPRLLAWIAIAGGTFLFAPGFGLGGVIGTYAVLDLIGFVLCLLFVLLSSVILLTDRGS